MTDRISRTRTSTSNFGVGRREGHDSSQFYLRFTPPEVSHDDSVLMPPWEPDNPFVHGDSTDLSDIPDKSVALVVTSPPYFVGKEYEEALGQGHIPGTYLEYLDMLYKVFEQCKRKLEPGGRIAVNVANLGRRPYRSLSADVIRILQDGLGFLLRGEVIWSKAEGSKGSCAWGSFKKATNPVLRDTTERIIIASKERFDRAKTVKERKKLELPFESTPSSDEFLEATLDLWRIPAESATRVRHPAPFPVELPQRLIELYTFKGDLVLDPFMGSGSTLVAAARTRRRFIGYDIDPNYVKIARERVEKEGMPEQEQIDVDDSEGEAMFEIPQAPEDEGFQARASREGKAAQGIAESVISKAGFTIVARNHRFPNLGLEINFSAEDRKGKKWYFDVSGAFTTTRAGLLRTDTLWKSLGRALVLTSSDEKPRIILLTTHLPRKQTAGYLALHASGPGKIFDAIEMLSTSGRNRLREYAAGECDYPSPGFWSEKEIDALRSSKM